MTGQETRQGPKWVNWDLTYACPLRCIHCYSESGRRDPVRLSLEQQLRIADAIIRARPLSVQLSGGEPLLVPGLFEIADRFKSSGIPVSLYTSGWLLTEPMVMALSQRIGRVHVSLDGATAEVHDFIRGRDGSFDRALHGLTLLNEYSLSQPAALRNRLTFGIDCAILQRNLHQLEKLCREMPSRFPALSFINLGVAVPSGLASRQEFAKTELLDQTDLAKVSEPEFAEQLRRILPATVKLGISDGSELTMRPSDIESGAAALTGLGHIEPDGSLRCNAIYEGVVGNLLEEPMDELWSRVQAQRLDETRARELSKAVDMPSWATATRNIDWHYGSGETRERISRRQEYVHIQGQPIVSADVKPRLVAAG